MRKILLVIVTLFVALGANAQFRIGVKGGLNVTRVSVSGNLSDNIAPDNREGFFIGLTSRIPLFVAPITIDASVLYDKMYAGVGDYDVQRELLCIPINAELNLSKHLFVFAGPQLDFDVSDKNYNLYSALSMVNDYKLNDANVSLNLGAGIYVGHMQFTVNYNKACGSMGDFNFHTVLDETDDIISGSAKADSWWLGLTYFF